MCLTVCLFLELGGFGSSGHFQLTLCGLRPPHFAQVPGQVEGSRLRATRSLQGFMAIIPIWEFPPLTTKTIIFVGSFYKALYRNEPTKKMVLEVKRINWGVLLVGVFVIRAMSFGVYTGAHMGFQQLGGFYVGVLISRLSSFGPY